MECFATFGQSWVASNLKEMTIALGMLGGSTIHILRSTFPSLQRVLERQLLVHPSATTGAFATGVPLGFRRVKWWLDSCCTDSSNHEPTFAENPHRYDLWWESINTLVWLWVNVLVPLVTMVMMMADGGAGDDVYTGVVRDLPTNNQYIFGWGWALWVV